MPVSVGNLVKGYYWMSLGDAHSTIHIRKFGDPDRDILCTGIATMDWMRKCSAPSERNLCQKCYGLYLLGLMSR
jgi:hypothetical protein